MWQASCILLGSALSNSSWVVISAWRWLILSSAMKCERWINQSDTSVGQRNIWVPDRNRTHDLLSTWRALYPLGYKNSWEARSFHWVHMRQASCISTGRISTVKLIVSSYKTMKMINLSSVMTCERWINQHDMSVGQRNIWVPNRNRTHDLLNAQQALYPLSYAK